MTSVHNSIIVNQIKEPLLEGGYTCVIAKDEQMLTTKHRGGQAFVGLAGC